ncbi:hypothetical protein H8B09_25680 [Paenibacillus sp. PR3]|uniref:Uncharacterized protein n=1 Tax=Paenibacillus terricola TaxID=2763503 RepID=A0ABR8N1Y0_9BACL|nr:hypothetical protein [Paenibacillus terricola]MBD3922172.1 hypothetical protein [Paenibacillus terricola]
MPFFERTNRMYKAFFALSSLFLLMTIFAFTLSHFQDIARYGILDHFMSAMWTVIFFVLTIFFLVLGVVLKKIAQDAEDDLSSLTRQVRELREALEGQKSASRMNMYVDNH